MADSNQQQTQSAEEAARKAAADKAAQDKAQADASKANEAEAQKQEAAKKKVRDLEEQLAKAKDEAGMTSATVGTDAETDKKNAEKAAPSKTILMSGRAGGPFNIEGEGLGTGGSVMLNGRVLETTRWNERSIKGALPADIGSGEVTIVTPAGTFKTQWPPKPAVPVQGPGGQTVLGQPR